MNTDSVSFTETIDGREVEMILVETWDGLYWRWIWQQADALEKTPRWAKMVSQVRKMDEDKRNAHLNTAAAYLRKLTVQVG